VIAVFPAPRDMQRQVDLGGSELNEPLVQTIRSRSLW
jgi:hypothetical protein